MSQHTQKNPYELRASLLQFAYEVCIKNAEHEALQSVDANGILKPKPVSAETIVKMAEEFNKFVSQSKNDKGSTQ